MHDTDSDMSDGLGELLVVLDLVRLAVDIPVGTLQLRERRARRTERDKLWLMFTIDLQRFGPIGRS